jgi:hypothetical protein
MVSATHIRSRFSENIILILLHFLLRVALSYLSPNSIVVGVVLITDATTHNCTGGKYFGASARDRSFFDWTTTAFYLISDLEKMDLLHETWSFPSFPTSYVRDESKHKSYGARTTSNVDCSKYQHEAFPSYEHGISLRPSTLS